MLTNDRVEPSDKVLDALDKADAVDALDEHEGEDCACNSDEHVANGLLTWALADAGLLQWRRAKRLAPAINWGSSHLSALANDTRPNLTMC